jgi:hypothetical protein
MTIVGRVKLQGRHIDRITLHLRVKRIRKTHGISRDVQRALPPRRYKTVPAPQRAWDRLQRIQVTPTHSTEFHAPLAHTHELTTCSPIAGGLFSATPTSRYTVGANPSASNWINLYKGDEKMKEATAQVAKIAEENGISAIELALRWVVHNSPLRKGDGVILGARTEEQLSGNVGAIAKGSLPDGVVKQLDEIWEGVVDVAPGAV